MSAGSPRHVFFSPVLGMWVVSRYDEVVAALKEPQIFSSAQLYADGASFVQMAPEAERIAGSVVPLSTPHMAAADPPVHTRLRRSVRQSFTPRRLASFEPHIRKAVDGLIDQFVDDGQVDIAARYTIPLPVLSVLLFIGVAEEDVPQIQRWYADWTMLMLSRATAEKQVEYSRSLEAFHGYLMELITKRRANPREDLASDLVRAVDEGEAELTPEELVNLLSQLIGAGSQTTTDSLNTALCLLLGERQQWEMIRKEPAQIPNVVEESLRCTRALRGPMRATTEQVELGGVSIPKGARVYLMHTVANRDAKEFQNPDTFDPERSDLHQHIAFGHGIHRCLGEWLARLEMKVALEALSARIPDMRLVPGQDLSVRESAVVRSLMRLLAEWHGSDAARTSTGEE
jgi:cytochrome P450